MSFYNILDYKGEPWNWVYVNSDPSLTPNMVRDIMFNVVDMFHHGEETREISRDDYEGEIELIDRQQFGTICGLCFTAKGESEGGSSELSVLLFDKIPKTKLN